MSIDDVFDSVAESVLPVQPDKRTTKQAMVNGEALWIIVCLLSRDSLFFVVESVAGKLPRRNSILERIDDLLCLLCRRKLELRLRTIFAILFLKSLDASFGRAPARFLPIPFRIEKQNRRPSPSTQYDFVELLYDLIAVFIGIIDANIVNCRCHSLYPLYILISNFPRPPRCLRRREWRIIPYRLGDGVDELGHLLGLRRRYSLVGVRQKRHL